MCTVLPSLRLNLAGLRRGVDNYHIDVRISPRFAGDVRRLTSALLSQATALSPQKTDLRILCNSLRESYRDLMTVLIHRIKTDLTADSIAVLEFAVFKHILITSRTHLDQAIGLIKEQATGSRNRPLANALTANERLFWLQKNYNALLLSINSQLFAQLERVERRQLRDVRQQYLPQHDHGQLDQRINPLLFTLEPGAVPLLIEYYRLWGTDGEDMGFNALNEILERLLVQHFPDLTTTPLMAPSGTGSPELYDDLGGILQSQKYMGLAADPKGLLTEEFTWFETPANLVALFDLRPHGNELPGNEARTGLLEWWRHRRQFSKGRRMLLDIIRKFKRHGVFTLLLASRHVKRIWTPGLAEQVEAKVLCQYLGGLMTTRKLQTRTLHGNTFTAAQLQQFNVIIQAIRKEAETEQLQSALAILQDISRYRRHLKYYRLAHRAFNRLKIVTQENELALSREAGTLYTLLTANELQGDTNRIVHHAIIKADVRGSTSVTEELHNKSLNPASYFSLRFFTPINKLLPLYGANKVFVEGDAVILSFLEHEKSPQQWFAVARACGLAKAMLNIVHSNNIYSEHMGLPKLELGIGLSYSRSAPYYLNDEEKPIMISGAISRADRLSSCAGKLRKLIDPGLFNVEVFRVSDNSWNHGEKAPGSLQYNVNGILLEAEGFEKLQQEIVLQRMKVNIKGAEVVLHIGKYPDVTGKSHDLVIREGKVGLWRGDSPVAGELTDEPFYEVVTNRRLIAQAVTARS